MMVPMISSLAALWLARVPAAYLLAHFFGPMNIHFYMRHRLGAGAGHLRAVLFLRPLERKKHCRARGRRKLNTKSALNGTFKVLFRARFFAAAIFDGLPDKRRLNGSTRSLYFFRTAMCCRAPAFEGAKPRHFSVRRYALPIRLQDTGIPRALHLGRYPRMLARSKRWM